MALRATNEAAVETISEVMQAAEARYWEGLEALVQGNSAAGVYTLGYVAEILLKTACFLFDGALVTDLVLPRLAPARALGTAVFPHVPCESYHGLSFWRVALVTKRNGRLPLPASIERDLDANVRVLADAWWVEMRYRAPRARAADGLDVFNSVSWIRAHHTDLWR